MGVLEQIDLKELTRTGKTRLPLSEAYTYEDLPLVDTVAVDVELELTTTGVTVSGVYRAILEEPCDRCLEPFKRSLYERFSERFVYGSLIDDAPSGGMELQAEDFYDTIGPDEMLDLKDLIHQYLVMALISDRVCERETCELHHKNS